MNVPIYPGSSSFFPGNTPFGFYDNDYQFQVDADKVTTFCSRRLGFPILEVELQDLNFYTAFEEAVTTYGNEIYAYKLRDNLLSLEGSNTSSVLNNVQVIPNMANIIRLTQQYGSEAGVGGNVTWYSGSISTLSGIQEYNLADFALSSSITGGIEIKRIFNYGPPASSQYNLFDSNIHGVTNFIDSSSAVSYFGSSNYILMPVNYDMQMIQSIEFNQTIRRSAYSFELINNILKIFPVPDGNFNLWFQYIKIDERLNNSIVPSAGKVTNISNANYTNPVYSQINSIGRSWIFEYTLALCKEMLGYVRGKYQNIPIPNDGVTLNQSDLITAATAERTALIEKLRTYLEETSRQALLLRRTAESDSTMNELGKSPLTIYIG